MNPNPTAGTLSYLLLFFFIPPDSFPSAPLHNSYPLQKSRAALETAGYFSSEEHRVFSAARCSESLRFCLPASCMDAPDTALDGQQEETDLLASAPSSLGMAPVGGSAVMRGAGQGRGIQAQGQIGNGNPVVAGAKRGTKRGAGQAGGQGVGGGAFAVPGGGSDGKVSGTAGGTGCFMRSRFLSSSLTIVAS